MEVTKKNFHELLPRITDLLKNASFVGIDGEFTGLGRSSANKYSDLDTPAERYLKDKHSVAKYGLIQIGNNENSYTYDASSMMFLAEHNFDFNKLFLDGLEFISLKEEENIRSKHEAKSLEERTLPTPIKVKDDKTKQFLIDAMDKVNLSKKNGAKCIFPGKSLNPFYRKLLYNNIASCFPCSSFNITGGSERNIEVIHYASELEREVAHGSSWEADLNQKKGLTAFIKALIDAEKPIVGHNTVLDVLHLVDKFVVSLPDSYEEFQCIMRNTLPDIFDTKLMAKDPPFSTNIVNTALNPLYEELKDIYKLPEMEVEEGFKSYSTSEDGQQHDAGYDAFMTGVCFITMLKVLDGKNWGKKSMMKSQKLDLYRNKINFMGSYDIGYLDLHKDQAIPEREYVLTVQCPSDFNGGNVTTLLSCISNYRYNWVNENLFHVMLRDEDGQTNIVSKFNELKAKSPPNVHVMMYNDFKKMELNNINKCNNMAVTKGEVKGNIPKQYVSNSNKNHTNSESRPKTLQISSKRSSNADGDEEENSLGTERRELKRLKSVGSEQLSNLTLESPSSTDLPKLVPKSKGKKKKAEKCDEFEVPDEW